MSRVLPFITLFFPAVAFAAPQNFRELVGLIVLIINVATPMLVALALVLFFWRAVLVMKGSGDGKGFSAAKFREVALWGVGILFVMVSIWGILALLENTFIGNDPGGVGNPSSSGDAFAPCNTLDGRGC